ncbi:MAG: hypothetical protein V3U56_14730, partial [Syntrophobacteria bacterium]
MTKTVGKHEEMGSTYCDVHGPTPEFKHLKSYEEITAFVSDMIKTFSDQEEYPLSEMAVLYGRRSLKEGENPLIPELCAKALEARG